MTKLKLKLALGLGAAALVLSACGQAVTGHTAAMSECVDIPDVDLFAKTAEGKLIAAAVGAVQVAPVAAPAVGASAIASRLSASFPGLGFPWMGLNLRGEVATLTGTAPTQEAKELAFAAGETAIKADTDASKLIRLVVDGISVEGGEKAVGSALAALDERPSLEACQRAFVETLEGRNVEFETGKAVISFVSARLLDAASGVALLCKDYNIEIGGHTDSRGDAGYNLNLSQQRATAVREYLIGRGVDGASLSAVGYGETRPLDPASTNAAFAKNRRTEFTVKAR